LKEFIRVPFQVVLQTIHEYEGPITVLKISGEREIIDGFQNSELGTTLSPTDGGESDMRDESCGSIVGDVVGGVGETA
jgi:hypothetical protein